MQLVAFTLPAQVSGYLKIWDTFNGEIKAMDYSGYMALLDVEKQYYALLSSMIFKGERKACA